MIANPLTAIGGSAAAITAQREIHRRTLANVLSTPNYWPSLDLFGWREVGERLNTMVREGRWDDMPAMISDEMLSAFVPTGHHEEIADVLREEFGDIARGIYLSLPDDPAEDRAVAAVVAGLQGG